MKENSLLHTISRLKETAATLKHMVPHATALLFLCGSGHVTEFIIGSLTFRHYTTLHDHGQIPTFDSIIPFLGQLPQDEAMTVEPNQDDYYQEGDKFGDWVHDHKGQFLARTPGGALIEARPK